GAGEWLHVLQRATKRLEDLKDPDEVGEWLERPDDAEQRRSLTETSASLVLLSNALTRRAATAKRLSSPLQLMKLIVEVRNKTAHGAYGDPFYASYATTVADSVDWL